MIFKELVHFHPHTHTHLYTLLHICSNGHWPATLSMHRIHFSSFRFHLLYLVISIVLATQILQLFPLSILGELVHMLCLKLKFSD